MRDNYGNLVRELSIYKAAIALDKNDGSRRSLRYKEEAVAAVEFFESFGLNIKEHDYTSILRLR